MSRLKLGGSGAGACRAKGSEAVPGAAGYTAVGSRQATGMACRAYRAKLVMCVTARSSRYLEQELLVDWSPGETWAGVWTTG